MAAGDVAQAILDNPLCTSCIAHKAGVSPDVVLATLGTMAKTMAIPAAFRPCRGCDEIRVTYVLPSRQCSKTRSALFV